MAIAKKSDRLGKEKIGPLLFKLSAPAIIGMIVHALYNIIDSIYVGHLSTEALSALSLSFPIQMLIIAIGVGTGIGASSLISRLLGQGNTKRASIVAEHVFFIAIIYGIVFGIIGLFFADKIIQIFTDDPVLIDLAKQYMQIILSGSIVVFIPATFNYILRGEGNTFAPMITMIIGAVLNIILDPFLIFGLWIFPELGIKGAAYATIGSRLFAGIFVTMVLLSDKTEFNLKLTEFTFDFQIIKEIYQVGVPAMLNRLIFSISIAVINKILGSFSSTAIAVMGVIFRLQSFFLMSVFGLAQGYLPLLGYNYGHRKPERMKKTIQLGSMAALGFGILASLIFRLFPEILLQMFNKDPEFLRIGAIALPRVGLAYIFMVINIIGATTFQALGRGFPSLVLTITRQFIFLIPGMLTLGHFFGLEAVWFALPLSEFTALLICVTWIFFFLRSCLSKIRLSNNPEEDAC